MKKVAKETSEVIALHSLGPSFSTTAINNLFRACLTAAGITGRQRSKLMKQLWNSGDIQSAIERLHEAHERTGGRGQRVAAARKALIGTIEREIRDATE